MVPLFSYALSHHQMVACLRHNYHSKHMYVFQEFICVSEVHVPEGPILTHRSQFFHEPHLRPPMRSTPKTLHDGHNILQISDVKGMPRGCGLFRI